MDIDISQLSAKNFIGNSKALALIATEILL